MAGSPDASERLLAVGLTALALAIPVSIAGTNIALVLVTAGLLAHLAGGKDLNWRRTWGPAAWCLGLYCAVACLTSLTGVAPSVSLQQLPKDFHKLWVFLVLTLAFRTKPERRLPAALALGVIFIAAFGIAQSALASYQSFLAYGIGWSWIRARAFVHPVTYGEVLAFGLLGGIAFLARRKNGDDESKAGALFLTVLAVAFILNQTRAAFLSLWIGFAAMCLADRNLRRRLKWAILAAVLGAVLFELLPTRRSIIASIWEMGATFGTAYSNPQLDRLALWDIAWRVFRDHHWLGVGPSNFATVFTQYHDGIIGHQRVWGSAHNIFLQQMAERGLIGLAALFALGWALLARAWQRARRAPDAWNLWALGATVAFFFMNLTETAFQNELVTTLFLLIWTRAEAQPDV